MCVLGRRAPWRAAPGCSSRGALFRGRLYVLVAGDCCRGVHHGRCLHRRCAGLCPAVVPGSETLADFCRRCLRWRGARRTQQRGAPGRAGRDLSAAELAAVARVAGAWRGRGRAWPRLVRRRPAARRRQPGACECLQRDLCTFTIELGLECCRRRQSVGAHLVSRQRWPVEECPIEQPGRRHACEYGGILVQTAARIRAGGIGTGAAGRRSAGVA